MTGIDENIKLLELVKLGDAKAEEKLVENNMRLVKSIALRFSSRGKEMEDLVQIGAMGLLKAIRNYDDSFGTAFSTYAVPVITGEIKRFLRDDGLIKVSREAKRNNYILLKAKEDYIAKNNREPRISELCEICGMELSDALYCVTACERAVSLQDKITEDGMTVEEVCGDDGLEKEIEKIALMQAIEKLDKESRKIIYMRYFKDMTQNEVARELGYTQVKVSRTEKKIMLLLRENMKCEGSG